MLTKEEREAIETRIKLLSEEFLANEEENRIIDDEIEQLLVKLDGEENE